MVLLKNAEIPSRRSLPLEGHKDLDELQQLAQEKQLRQDDIIFQEST